MKKEDDKINISNEVLKESSSVTESVTESVKDSAGASPDVYPPKEEDEVEVDLTDFSESGMFVDTSKEDTEQKLSELRELSSTLSNASKEAYLPLVSIEGLDMEDAIRKESDVERAYFLSDAYKHRVVRSLGYNSLDDMSPEHRKVYDDMVKRGEQLSQDNGLRIGIVDRYNRDIIHSVNQSKDGGSIILINPEEKGLGMSIPSHEIGHHVYNLDGINPGVISGKGKLYGGEQQYGTEDSPLSTINEKKASPRAARDIYKSFFKGMSYIADDDKAVKDIVNGYVRSKEFKEHDNAGVERAADIHGVRMMMMQEGIWNPFDGSDVKVEQLQEFRKKHPDCRLFEYWNEKEAVYYLNNIAQNDVVKPDGIKVTEGDDGHYRLVASIGSQEVSRDVSERDLNRLYAVDDGKRGLLLSRYFDGTGISFDSDVPLDTLLLSSEASASVTHSESSPVISDGESMKTGLNHRDVHEDYAMLSLSNYEVLSRGSKAEEERSVERGLGV